MKAAVAVGFLIWSALPAGAQVLHDFDPRIAVNARVRFRLPGDSALIEGRIRSKAEDRIVVMDGSGRITPASLRDLDAVEIRDRKSDLTLAFAGAGFIAGSVLYLKWCSQNRHDCDGQDRDDDLDGRPDSPPMFAIMSFGTALATGLIGYAITPLQWQTVQVHVGFGLESRDAQVQLRLTLGRR